MGHIYFVYKLGVNISQNVAEREVEITLTHAIFEMRPFSNVSVIVYISPVIGFSNPEENNWFINISRHK